MTTHPPDPTPDSDQEVELLRAMLATNTTLRRFPPALERSYLAYSLERGLRLTRDSFWLALLAFISTLLLIRWLVRHQSTPELLAGNLAVFDCALLAEALVFALLASTPWLVRQFGHYTLWGSLTSASAVCVVAVAASAFPQADFNIFGSYVVILVIAICYATGIVNVRMTTWACIGGTLAALLIIKWQGYWFDAAFFAAYAVLANGVGVLIAHLLDELGRVSFLQSRLLAAEKIRVDNYAAEVSRLAREDALTGLANRRHFNDALEREWSVARRQQSSLAVLFVDVDYFKAYNDMHGHQAGDRVLAAIGRAFAGAIRRPTDLAARYGGEEFVLLLPDTSLNGACVMATQIEETIAALAIPHGASAVADRITVSIGIAAQIPADNNSAQLVTAADTALYAAKNAGRNQVKVAGAAPSC